MFAAMRAALGIPRTVDILSHIRSLPTPSDRLLAIEKIQAIEREAMVHQTPQPHLLALMTHLESRGIRKGLCTRNFPAPVQHLREKFLAGVTFEGVVTRDTLGVRAKPEGDGLWSIIEGWDGNSNNNNNKDSPQGEEEGAKGPVTSLLTSPTATIPSPNEADDRPNPYASLPPPTLLELRHRLGANVLMVGDSIDDMLAARSAGAASVLLVNQENRHLLEHESVDLGVASLGELVGVLEQGFEGVER